MISVNQIKAIFIGRANQFKLSRDIPPCQAASTSRANIIGERRDLDKNRQAKQG